ncbi:MAG: 3-deoxy-D-manno-octulosonic acid transferase [Planctomycetota bacterium]|nr:3-deoxy-D-manno-octulosonic acid transferase [Planctomycetota bacterium]
MRFVADLVYLFAGLLFSPVVVYRRLRHNRYRQGWAQRFGNIRRKDPRRKCIWLHAVSVGEVNAAKTLVAEIEKRFADFEIVVSTTTDTGFARATALFGGRWTVFYFPFDFSWVMRKAFGRINPTLCLLMELEVWPNFVDVACRRSVPVVVVNGRISDRSFASYRRFRWLIRGFFGKIDLVLAQTEEYAGRFRTLGCPAERVVVTGSLKYDTAQVAERVEGAETLAGELNLAGERLWVAGGTGNDEEKIILRVYRSLKEDPSFADLRLAVVPRKPERFDEVAQWIEQMGLPLLRYSQIKGRPDHAVPDANAVILGDTMGDLRKFYSLATVVFVGRSLVPMGGSDMMEAAALGKCTIFGPHAFNFRQTVEALLAEKGAIEVVDGDELMVVLTKCFTDPAYAETIAQRGRQVILNNQGATARTIDHITRRLQSL